MAGRKRKQRWRKCAHCGERFPVDCRIGLRHRFCSKPECAHESHAQAQQRWRRGRKGRNYFQGGESTVRVREWRKRNRDYWRSPGRLAGVSIRPPLAAVLRELALQDMIDPHLSLLAGLIAEVSNLSQQDAIASELRRLMLRGHGILQDSASPVSRANAPSGPRSGPRMREA